MLHMDLQSEAFQRKKFPTIANFWGIFALLILASAVIGGTLALLLPGDKGVSLFLGYSVPFVIAIVILLMIQKHEFDAKFSSLFGKFDLQIVPYLLLFVLGFGYVAQFVTELIPMPTWIKTYFEGLFQVNIWTFLSVCIAAPLLEEILCRGILLRSFLINYSVKKALFWSAFFFAVLHLNPWQAIPAFGLGYFMAWLFYKTNSLIPAILVHFLNNFISYVSAYFFEDKFNDVGSEVGWSLNVAFLLLGLGLVIFSFYRVNKTLKGAEKGNL